MTPACVATAILVAQAIAVATMLTLTIRANRETKQIQERTAKTIRETDEILARTQARIDAMRDRQEKP